MDTLHTLPLTTHPWPDHQKFNHIIKQFFRLWISPSTHYHFSYHLFLPKSHFHFHIPLTLSLLGYLKTRIRWGGGNLTPPPSKSHVWCPNMTNDTSLESSCALLLESAKKFANLQKLNFFIAKSRYIVKMFAKKKNGQKMKNYTFLKSPWPCHFKYAKSFAKF